MQGSENLEKELVYRKSTTLKLFAKKSKEYSSLGNVMSRFAAKVI